MVFSDGKALDRKMFIDKPSLFGVVLERAIERASR